MMTITSTHAPRSAKITAQSGCCRISWDMEIPLATILEVVAGKKGPVLVHWVLGCITRIYWKIKKKWRYKWDQNCRAQDKVNGYTFKERNSVIFIVASKINWGHLINKRICSHWSKFFSLTEDPILRRLRVTPEGKNQLQLE